MSSGDSIKVFYDSLFTTFKSDYLLNNEVDWTEVETEIKGNLAKFTNFKSSLSQTTILFDKIKATHCQLYYYDTVYTATSKIFTEKDFSEQWLKKYSNNPVFTKEERVKTFVFYRDREKMKLMDERVKMAREYYKTITLNGKN